MSDEEILRKFVDLSKSDMTDEEKEEWMEFILDHRDAFSLRDESGECPNITIDIMSLMILLSLLDHFLSVKRTNQSWIGKCKDLFL